jgi:hypothetical protein
MEIVIKVKTSDPIEADLTRQYLQALADNITKDNLKILASKSSKEGINKQIPRLQYFI